MVAKYCVIAGIAWGTSAVWGQAASAPPAFDVVSIKPSAATNTDKTFHLGPDGSFQAGNYSLKDLIRLGWDVRNFQILGGPGWLDTERYNVQAKPVAPFAAHSTEGFKQLGLMVQAMLAERFQIKVHRQTKEMAVYYLALGKGESKLKRTGDAMDPTTRMGDGRGRMWAVKFSMALLANYLGGELGVAVLDRTGLSGVYDLELKWNPDDGRRPTDSGPSIFAALQEQLGLKLESGRGPVEVLVVDSAERPSAN